MGKNFLHEPSYEGFLRIAKAALENRNLNREEDVKDVFLSDEDISSIVLLFEMARVYEFGDMAEKGLMAMSIYKNLGFVGKIAINFITSFLCDYITYLKTDILGSPNTDNLIAVLDEIALDKKRNEYRKLKNRHILNWEEKGVKNGRPGFEKTYFARKKDGWN